MESFFIVSSISDAIEVNENIQPRNAPADIQTKRVNGHRVSHAVVTLPLAAGFSGARRPGGCCA